VQLSIVYAYVQARISAVCWSCYHWCRYLAYMLCVS